MERHWQIKLRLLASIARSQEALSRLLESAADVGAAAGGDPAVLLAHVRAMRGMQAALLRTVRAGGGWEPPKRGRPVSPPWLRAGICAADSGEREEERREDRSR